MKKGTKDILALLTVFLYGILPATFSYIHAGENVSIGKSFSDWHLFQDNKLNPFSH
jgi:hypothetical protein